MYLHGLLFSVHFTVTCCSQMLRFTFLSTMNGQYLLPLAVFLFQLVLQFLILLLKFFSVFLQVGLFICLVPKFKFLDGPTGPNCWPSTPLLLARIARTPVPSGLACCTGWLGCVVQLARLAHVGQPSWPSWPDWLAQQARLPGQAGPTDTVGSSIFPAS